MHAHSKDTDPGSQKGRKGVLGVAIQCMKTPNAPKKKIQCMKVPNAPKKKPPPLRLSAPAEAGRLPGVEHILSWARECVCRDLRAELERSDMYGGVLGK